MTITTDKDCLCVELHGREQFWALRAKISILKDTITDVRFEPEFRDWKKWEVRMPGTHMPTKLLAGSYWTEDGWDFMFIRRPMGFAKPRAADVLVIETNADRYRRVIVSSDAAESSSIIKWWNQTHGKTNQTKISRPATQRRRQAVLRSNRSSKLAA